MLLFAYGQQRDTQSAGVSCPFNSCNKTAPMAIFEASVCNMKLLVKFGKADDFTDMFDLLECLILAVLPQKFYVIT